MPRRERPTIALLATHGAAASVLYGMYDLFHSAGRDWPPMIGLPPGESAFHPLIVARDTAPLNVVNDIVVTPRSPCTTCLRPTTSASPTWRSIPATSPCTATKKKPAGCATATHAAA